MNDEASRLLDLDTSFVGSTIDRLGLEPALVAELTSGRQLQDAVHVVGDRVLVVNQAPAHWDGRDVGSVVTLRDRTELQSVTAELDTVRGLAEALRAQNHESSNRMHTMVSLIEIGRSQEAIDFATRELDVARRLTDRMVESIDEPVIAALLLGKSAQAAERGVTLTIEPATDVTGLATTAHEAVTILGNLIDNAIDAAQSSDDRQVSVTISSTTRLLHVRVEDSGPGIEPQGPRDRVRPRLVDQGRRRHRPRDRTGAGRPARTPARWRRHDRREPARRRGVRRQDRLMTAIRVLIVEDEAIAAQAHKTYVERMHEFEVVAVAESFQEAARVLGSQPVDLVLLDMHLPDGHGLDLLRQLRATGRPYDVIAVTSARDVDVVRQSVSQGVVAYLLKPFTFAMFEAKLRQYAAFRRTLEAGDESIDQRGVDAVFGAMRPAPEDERAAQGAQRGDARGRTHDTRGGGERAHRGRGRRGDRLVTGDGAALPGAPRGPRSVGPGHAVRRHRPPARGVSRRQVVTGSGVAGPQALPTHHSPSSSSASSPNGLTPGPLASEWPTRTCRHLTRVGIPPAVIPSISGTWPIASRSARYSSCARR